jgi:hypothetical protein
MIPFPAAKASVFSFKKGHDLSNRREAPGSRAHGRRRPWHRAQRSPTRARGAPGAFPCVGKKKACVCDTVRVSPTPASSSPSIPAWPDCPSASLPTGRPGSPGARVAVRDLDEAGRLRDAFGHSPAALGR